MIDVVASVSLTLGITIVCSVWTSEPTIPVEIELDCSQDRRNGT